MPKKKTKKSSRTKKSVKEKKLPDFSAQAPHLNKRKMWMWFGVTFVSAAIIFLWAWSLKVGFNSFSWNNSKERQLISNVKNDWQQNFSADKQDAESIKDEEKIIIQNKLQNIITQNLVTSTDNNITTSSDSAIIGATSATTTTSTEDNK